MPAKVSKNEWVPIQHVACRTWKIQKQIILFCFAGCSLILSILPNPDRAVCVITTNLLYRGRPQLFLSFAVSIQAIIVSFTCSLFTHSFQHALSSVLLMTCHFAVYVDVGNDNSPVTLSVITSGPTYSRSWKIKVTQIKCNSLTRGMRVIN